MIAQKKTNKHLAVKNIFLLLRNPTFDSGIVMNELAKRQSEKIAVFIYL